MDTVSQAAFDRLTPMLAEADRPVLALLLPYFNKNSLLLAGNTGSGDELVCDFANDCERLRLSIGELRAAYAALRSGQRLDWSVYTQVK